MTTPQQAREQLDRAQRLSSSAAGFNPVWTIYVGLCGAASMYALGSFYSGSGGGAILWMSFAWIFVFVALIPVFTRYYPNARRGFGKRWTLMMLLWAATWTATVFVPLPLTTAVAFSSIYLFLAVIGCVWEATSGGNRE